MTKSLRILKEEMKFYILSKCVSITKRSSNDILLVILIFFLSSSITDAYDPLDPNGNITVKWDIMSWTSDGYIAMVTILNFQKYRHIESPGWKLGWTWAKKEIIWSMLGGQTTEQGDCLKFKGNIPHCCKKDPTVVDLLPETPCNMRTTNCCRGGVLNSRIQDHANSVASFQVTVGQAGTTNKTVRAPENFNLGAPGPGYTCGPTTLVKRSKFITSDRRRFTQALISWNVTCSYSQFVAQKTPTCCVSLSSFYSETIVNCPACSRGCQNRITQPGSCVGSYTPHIALALTSPDKSTYTPLVHCTRHMCPIRVHWHVRQNYREYWRVKISITNFNYRMNYSQWNIVVQHPNFNNLTESFSFNYKPIPAYGFINDIAMLWGVKYYNDLLIQAGPYGSVQSEILFGKNKHFTFDKGWAFPRRIYFNGESCVMPPPDEYPYMPKAAAQRIISVPKMVMIYLILLLISKSQ